MTLLCARCPRFDVRDMTTPKLINLCDMTYSGKSLVMHLLPAHSRFSNSSISKYRDQCLLLSVLHARSFSLSLSFSLARVRARALSLSLSPLSHTLSLFHLHAHTLSLSFPLAFPLALSLSLILHLFTSYRVVPGHRNHVFDPASVFLTTH